MWKELGWKTNTDDQKMIKVFIQYEVNLNYKFNVQFDWYKFNYSLCCPLTFYLNVIYWSLEWTYVKSHPRVIEYLFIYSSEGLVFLMWRWSQALATLERQTWST